jgi:hypothetical protein
LIVAHIDLGESVRLYVGDSFRLEELAPVSGHDSRKEEGDCGAGRDDEEDAADCK